MSSRSSNAPWRRADRGTDVAGMEVEGQPDSVEIPPGLLGYFQPHTCLGVRMRDTGRGSLILPGVPVTDARDLS